MCIHAKTIQQNLSNLCVHLLLVDPEICRSSFTSNLYVDYSNIPFRLVLRSRVFLGIGKYFQYTVRENAAPFT